MICFQRSVVAQQRAQALSRVTEMPARHHFRHVEVRGNLSMSPSFEIVQQHDLPMHGAELLERVHESAPKLFPQRGRIRRGMRRHVSAVFDRLRPSDAKVVAPVVRRVSDNAHQPRTESIRITTFMDVLPCADERILTDVFSIGITADTSESDEVRGAKVPPHQPFECGGVSQAHPGDEGCVGFRHPYL